MASADLSRINTNLQALNALNALNRINTQLSVHSLRLATGKRINSAADDAAGFTIASKLKVKSEGLGTAIDNIGTAKNYITTAEGHLTNISDILSKMKSKAQQAASDTLGSEERTAIYDELDKFNDQIDAEVAQAEWAGVSLLPNGNVTNKVFQIGTGTSTTDELQFNISNHVFGAQASTFDSAGLHVEVGAAAKTNTEVSTATSNVQIGTAFATTAVTGNLTELAAGSYTLMITTQGGGSAAGSGTITATLYDAYGAAVTIDADGDNGTTTTTDTSLSTTFSGADGNPTGASIDLGIGIDFDLTGIATASGAAGSVIYKFDYARAGNNVSTMEAAQTFMGAIDDAIDQVSKGLGYIGSMVNRLEYQEESLSVAKSNTESAYSRIVDADMAFEQLEATKLMILQQTATAMLAQANVAPQSILSLFG